MSRLLRNIFMFVVYAYLYIPIIILVTNSFNEDRYGLSWKGFSWNWYERLLIRYLNPSCVPLCHYCLLCCNVSHYCGRFDCNCALSLSFPW